MVPKKGVAGILFRLGGESFFLNLVCRNLLNNIRKIKDGRAHTFLSNNAQTVEGVSNNMGAERYYAWQNSIIDCREMPKLLASDALAAFVQKVERQQGFIAFQKALADRSNGYLKASVFVKTIQGQEKKRYNIRLSAKSKYEDFDIVRTGICVKADSPEDFKLGLFYLLEWEKQYHPDYRGLLVIPARAPA